MKIKPTDERYTPSWLIDLVKRALGPIGLDACTTRHNPVGAEFFCFLPERDGLTRDWAEYASAGTVWINPPFSQLRRWCAKVVQESSSCDGIVLLTPVDPSTEWYSTLFAHADVACQLHDRVKFIAPSDQAQLANVAMQPTMLWYFGRRVKAFCLGFEGKAHLFFPGVLR